MSKPMMIITAAIVLAFVVITAWRSFDEDDEPPRGPAPYSADARVVDDSRQRTAAFWQAYRESTALRMAGKRAEAAAAYERALALDADHQDALYYRGNMLADLERYDEARESWERLITVNPSSARGHARLGDLYFCVGSAYEVDLDRARAAYRRAHAINREETGHLARLGEVALAIGERQAARRHFEDILAAHTSSPDAHFFLAYLDRLSGDLDAAIVRLERGRTAREPETPEGMTGEGDTLSDEPQFERAGCSELHEVVDGLAHVPQAQLLSAAEHRFELLDDWLAQRRQVAVRSESGS